MQTLNLSRLMTLSFTFKTILCLVFVLFFSKYCGKTNPNDVSILVLGELRKLCEAAREMLGLKVQGAILG